MNSLSRIDQIRLGVGEYSSGTANDRLWVKDKAVGWVNTLLAHIDDLERQLERAKQDRARPAVVDVDDDPSVCRCSVVARPPCGPCERGDVTV